jgi:hypothetical protein
MSESENLLWAISTDPEGDSIELTMFTETRLTVPLLLLLIASLADHARRLSR